MEYFIDEVFFKLGLKVQFKFVRMKRRSVCKGIGVFKKCMVSFEESSCVVWLILGVYEGVEILKRQFLIICRLFDSQSKIVFCMYLLGKQGSFEIWEKNYSINRIVFQ